MAGSFGAHAHDMRRSQSLTPPVIVHQDLSHVRAGGRPALAGKEACPDVPFVRMTLFRGSRVGAGKPDDESSVLLMPRSAFVPRRRTLGARPTAASFSGIGRPLRMERAFRQVMPGPSWPVPGSRWGGEERSTGDDTNRHPQLLGGAAQGKAAVTVPNGTKGAPARGSPPLQGASDARPRSRWAGVGSLLAEPPDPDEPCSRHDGANSGRCHGCYCYVPSRFGRGHHRR